MNLKSVLFRLEESFVLLNHLRTLGSIEGWLMEPEALALLMLAAEGPGAGAVVEIGSYLGRSTAFLAAGSKSTGREKVVAVDHFQGSPENRAGQFAESAVLKKEGTTYNQFMANLKRVQLDDYVTPIVASSRDAVRTWNNVPIRLLFIDGDHSYESSRQDFECWSPFVCRLGLVGFHDVGTWPGVTQFYQELVKSNPAYREVATINSVKVVQRVSV